MSDRRYDIRYKGADGTEWKLSHDEWVAGLRSGGLDGLIGEVEARTIETLDAPGVSVESLRFPPSSGTLRVLVRTDGEDSAQAVWARFRRAFRIRRPYGELIVGSPLGEVRIKVRTSGLMSKLDVDSEFAEYVPMEIPLVADDPAWVRPLQRGQGIVTVTNQGDVDVWPKIAWSGSGGQVELPSGATFTLPAVGSVRVLDLHPRRSRGVFRESGERDAVLWKQLRGVVLSECVPPDESRQYVVPAGAVLEWHEGVLDPWR